MPRFESTHSTLLSLRDLVRQAAGGAPLAYVIAGWGEFGELQQYSLAQSQTASVYPADGAVSEVSFTLATADRTDPPEPTEAAYADAYFDPSVTGHDPGRPRYFIAVDFPEFAQRLTPDSIASTMRLTYRDDRHVADPRW